MSFFAANGFRLAAASLKKGFKLEAVSFANGLRPAAASLPVVRRVTAGLTFT